MGQMYSDLLLVCCAINHKVTTSLWDRMEHQRKTGMIFHFGLFLLLCSPNGRYDQVLNPAPWYLHIEADLVFGEMSSEQHVPFIHQRLAGRETEEECRGYQDSLKTLNNNGRYISTFTIPYAYQKKWNTNSKTAPHRVCSYVSRFGAVLWINHG